MLSCKCFEIFKNTYIEKHRRMAAFSMSRAKHFYDKDHKRDTFNNICKLVI